MLICLWTRRYISEHKSEWNLPLIWLFLAIVACYLNNLDKVVLALPFWALATFPVCFSVLSSWTNRAPSVGTKWSGWIWGGDTICEKAIYVPNDCFVSVGLQWTNIKIGEIVTLYQRELFKKFPRLGTFCTQSVNEMLRRYYHSVYCGKQHNTQNYLFLDYMATFRVLVCFDNSSSGYSSCCSWLWAEICRAAKKRRLPWPASNSVSKSHGADRSPGAHRPPRHNTPPFPSRLMTLLPYDPSPRIRWALVFTFSPCTLMTSIFKRPTRTQLF